MFNISPALKESIKGEFSKVTAAVNDLSPQIVVGSKGVEELSKIGDMIETAHNAFLAERKRQNGRDPESKELLFQLARLYNGTTGLMDLIKAGDAGSESVVSYKKEVAELIHNFGKLAKRLQEANTEKTRKQIARDGGVEIAMSPDERDRQEVANREDRLKEMEREEEESLQKYSRYATDMPVKDSKSMGDSKLLMFDIPVIPLIQFPLDPSKLKGIGIQADSIGMYVVMLKQRMLGVNPEAIKASKQKLDDYVDNALEAYSKRKGTKWMCVSETPQVYQSRGLQFFWIMEARKLTRLLQMTHGAIDEWGFPFAMKARTMRGSGGRQYTTDTGPLPKVHVPERQSELPGTTPRTQRDGVPRWSGRVER